ncbi:MULTISPECIES: hypothetical protein [unclassified Methanopyrus]|uniref:hypothetical protein n=1 Tax=Methanopyrus sp. SNP6 TaxID=1937005 RepID=UPI00143B7BBC|nr:hypothetical protein [Methanopyrus sp. SNP6]
MIRGRKESRETAFGVVDVFKEAFIKWSEGWARLKEFDREEMLSAYSSFFRSRFGVNFKERNIVKLLNLIYGIAVEYRNILDMGEKTLTGKLRTYFIPTIMVIMVKQFYGRVKRREAMKYVRDALQFYKTAYELSGREEGFEEILVGSLLPIEVREGEKLPKFFEESFKDSTIRKFLGLEGESNSIKSGLGCVFIPSWQFRELRAEIKFGKGFGRDDGYVEYVVHRAGTFRECLLMVPQLRLVLVENVDAPDKRVFLPFDMLELVPPDPAARMKLESLAVKLTRPS